MQPPPLLSVLIPAYNAERFLGEALRSVLRQTITDLEVIVINDGSTDATARILEEVHDSRLRVFYQENRGYVFSLNRALSEARGQFVARMDADDISLSRRLELQLTFLENHPQVACVGCQFAQIDEDGKILNNCVPLPEEHEAIVRRLEKAQLGILHPSMLCRTEALRAIGGYDERISNSEDLDLFYRLAARFRLANINQVAFLYRITRSAVSTKFFSSQRKNERILRAAWKRSLVSGQYRLVDADYRNISPATKAAPSPKRISAHYYNRVGRALLRGGRWREARLYYFKSAINQPLQLLAYFGMLRSFLHLGKVPQRLPWAEESAQ